MADGDRMSRRDWFRLRPRRNATPDQADATSRVIGEAPDALQEMAHPVNHDGMDLSELPPMREALLSEVQVRQLFSDIESLGSDILLMQRSARSQRASASTATSTERLCTARDALLSGTIPRVQVRYLWQNTNWIDTLELRADGVRLVRIAHNKTNIP